MFTIFIDTHDIEILSNDIGPASDQATRIPLLFDGLTSTPTKTQLSNGSPTRSPGQSVISKYTPTVAGTYTEVIFIYILP